MSTSSSRISSSSSWWPSQTSHWTSSSSSSTRDQVSITSIAKLTETVCNVSSFHPIARRVFLMGPPGTFRTECAKQIGEETGWQPIQTGYLLKDEESKKTSLGGKINEAKKAYHYSKYHLSIFLENCSRSERYTFADPIFPI